MKKQKILIFLLSTIIFFSTFFIAYGWFEPTTNILSEYAAPINTTATAQTKGGSLIVPMIYDYDNVSYYIDPSNINSGNLAGKIISDTSILQTDPDKTLITKDYVDNLCILVLYATTCPNGYSSLSGIASTGGTYKMCCRAQ
ncbi:MAG: hypothetical protein PHO58_04320 [Bacilli bacterium]|nr:hypothetical protein [Candidatus Paceibacterota bacterium]MDD4411706.1 hypothetical protein [Bacilli bacterium]